MSTATSELDNYVTAVHAALADLSDAEREDLLDDLPQHLADLQADRGGALTDLIGTPEAYAAELRATAGLEPTPGVHPWRQSLRSRLAAADAQLGALLRYDRFVDLLRALAPAWWLLRAYLVVQVCTRANHRFGSHALVPQLAGSRALGVVVLVGACAGSVWLGRRGVTREWQRVVGVLLGLALLGFGVALVHRIDETATVYVGDDSYTDDSTSGISNIYPVGPDGTVLQNVRLYDQDGNPVVLGNAVCADDGSGVGDGTVQGPGQLIYKTSIPAASASASSADGAALYPLTCAANQGPFGSSSQAPAAPRTCRA